MEAKNMTSEQSSLQNEGPRLRLGLVWLILGIDAVAPVTFACVLKWFIPAGFAVAVAITMLGLIYRHNSARKSALVIAIVSIPMWALDGSMFGMAVDLLSMNPGELQPPNLRALIGGAVIFGLIAFAINLPLIRRLRTSEVVQAFSKDK
jgi:hypothetical protein